MIPVQTSAKIGSNKCPSVRTNSLSSDSTSILVPNLVVSIAVSSDDLRKRTENIARKCREFVGTAQNVAAVSLPTPVNFSPSEFRGRRWREGVLARRETGGES